MRLLCAWGALFSLLVRNLLCILQFICDFFMCRFICNSWFRATSKHSLACIFKSLITILFSSFSVSCKIHLLWLSVCLLSQFSKILSVFLQSFLFYSSYWIFCTIYLPIHLFCLLSSQNPCSVFQILKKNSAPINFNTRISIWSYFIFSISMLINFICWISAAVIYFYFSW